MEMASKINIDYFNLIFNTTISTRLKSTEPKAGAKPQTPNFIR